MRLYAVFRAKSQSGSNSKSRSGMSDGTDEIPTYSSSSSMNFTGDIAQLSYKELQALALRYRVPGNVKKKVLVKVLQAARSGNEMEFSRLLQELRKNRKRKARKSKDSKLGITSTPLHSPDYIMADDDYYCQQQQQQQQPQAPYQWIGAEEEIVSKDDDKFPHYEEFKQFLLKRIQREFQACDNNNNSVQMQDLHLDTIMDLQNAPISPNLQMMPLDGQNYLKSNLINDADPLAISSVDRSSYQVLKEPEGSSQGSFLLKRMLQAPVGANLGEIASSLFWASNLLDNSDTLTAESESNENEDRELDEELALEEQFADTNPNDYCLLKNKSEYLLNEANLISQQVPSMLPTDDQYRFPNEANNRPNNSYQNWTITSVTEVPNGDLQSPKIFHAIYYNNTDPTMTAANNNMTYQYQNDTACNGGQNLFNFDAQDTNSYATGTDMMTTNNSNDIYLQNFGKHNGEMGTEYFRNVDTFGQNNAQQNAYADNQQYQYFYPRPEEAIDPLNERLEQQQNNVMAEVQNDVINQETVAENLHRPINGTVEPFWPKWTTQPNNNLENILNYHISKQVDYSKLNMTSCVYCYDTPIVMHQPSHGSIPTDSGCWHERRYTAEQRQHSFLPYWMLYNDTSQGMRMTNMPSPTMPTHTIIPSNDNLKDIIHDTSVAPINDVWMNQYEPASIADEMNVHVSDPLFCSVTADRMDDIPDTPDIVKT